MRGTSGMAFSSLAQTVAEPGPCVPTRSGSTGNPRSRQLSKPPSSGRTRASPALRSWSAARALVASFGHVQYRTISRSPGNSLCRRSISSAATRSVELLLQLVRRDPGDSEKAEKAAPPSVLDEDIRPEGGTRHRQRRRTQMRDLLRRDALEHIAGEIPETCPRTRPGQPARTGIEEEPRRPEAKDAGQGGGDRVQPREKFREQQSSNPPREKDLLRAPNAGIRLERERAQPRERAVATPPPEGVPEHVGDERGTRCK